MSRPVKRAARVGPDEAVALKAKGAGKARSGDPLAWLKLAGVLATAFAMMHFTRVLALERLQESTEVVVDGVVAGAAEIAASRRAGQGGVAREAGRDRLSAEGLAAEEEEDEEEGGLQREADANFGSQPVIELVSQPAVQQFFRDAASLAGEPAEDAAPPESLLPRTSAREYNVAEPGRRYLLYSPSGGFNNQLACFLSASYMAMVYNRTLIVPANGKHSSMAWGYYALKQPDVIPMDHALDFEYLEKTLGVPLLPLNITIKQFHREFLHAKRESNDIVDVIHAPKSGGLYNAPPSVLRKYLERGKASSKQFLWFEGRFYTKYWARKFNLYRFIRYSPMLRTLSYRIAHKAFNGTRFNAFHIRMGDYVKKLKQESSANSQAFVRVSKRLHFDRDTPVYIATDGSANARYFRALRAHFPNIVFQRDLMSDPDVRDWIAQFHRSLPKTEIRSDLFGLVEQMLCVQAHMYIGTSVSTFSQTIAKTRHSIRNAFPEVDIGGIGLSALAHWDGTLSYLKHTPDLAVAARPRWGSGGGGAGSSIGVSDGAEDEDALGASPDTPAQGTDTDEDAVEGADEDADEDADSD